MDYLHKLMVGENGFSFLPHIALRSIIMFFVLLVALRILGKRGVKQLSVFEMAIIISLGSSAGDPMIYEEIGILMSITVFLSIALIYRLIVLLVSKSKTVETMIEGNPLCLISDGKFSLANFKKELMAQDEFFAELRMQHVEHLGQLRLAIVETSGEMSLYYYEDEDVKYGLPIIPEVFNKKSKMIEKEGNYSCSFCGTTEFLTPSNNIMCKECKHLEWVSSLNCKRIT